MKFKYYETRKMKRITLFLAGAVAVASIFANAEESKNLVVNGNAADGLNNWSGIQQVVDGGPDGAKCFEAVGNKFVGSQEFIPVDNNPYQLTGWFKSGDDKPNQIYFGLRMFDENKRFIDSTSVNVQAKSETTLAAEAKKGETVIKVKDAASWQPLMEKKRLTIAFDADDSGEYKDLPNFKYYIASNLEKKGDDWEVTLAKPLAADFSASTKVRAHFASGHYMYVFAVKKNLTDWTKVSKTINSIAKSGTPYRLWKI